MDRLVVGYVAMALLIILLGVGVPIGFLMLLLGFFGYFIMQGSSAAFAVLGGTIWANFNNYAFTVTSMFVLMGFFAYHAQFGADLFTTIRKWVGNIPGALATSVCFGCAAFGTVSGDSISTVMTIGRIAVPEMQKANYDVRIASGVLASAGPIAAMIPPSVLMVLYSLATEQPVGKLLMGGFLPGIITAIVFATVVVIWTRVNPKIAPRTTEQVTWRERFDSLKQVWMVVICAGFILGGIYTGVFTPTEAGGMAAIIVLIVGVANRRLKLNNIWQALMDSAKVIGTVMLILIGSLMFNAMFALTGISQLLVNILAPAGAPAMAVLIGIMVLYLILGCFLSAIAMLFLTMPFVFPIIIHLGINPIWFGILVVHMCEVGSITPPFGITLFAVKTLLPPETSTTTIVKGAMPFFAGYIVVLAILLAFPQIPLFLPSLMK